MPQTGEACGCAQHLRRSALSWRIVRRVWPSRGGDACAVERAASFPPTTCRCEPRGCPTPRGPLQWRAMTHNRPPVAFDRRGKSPCTLARRAAFPRCPSLAVMT
jgi:hypothetical protein